jgi:cytochrome P450
MPFTNATDVAPAPLFSPEFLRDPYPTYRHHLAGPALQPLPGRPGFWLLFGYADCVKVMREPSLTSARPASVLVNAPAAELHEFDELVNHMQRWLLLRDAPQHTELRKAMNRGFTPLVVDALHPQVDAIIGHLLDQFEHGETVDLIRDFAYPLPVRVICHLLGLPEELHDRCVTRSNQIAVWFGNPQRTPALARIAQDAIGELVSFFQEATTRRRRESRDDLLDLLIRSADSAKMSSDELYAQCVMLLFAGHETTRNLIGNGIYTLLKNPDACEELRTNASLAPAAVEELLRIECPIQGFSRGTKTDIEVDGKTVAAGSWITFMIGAAHRDPRQFPEPDQLNIHRPHNRHLAFGGDAHVCLGSTLARLEGRQSISAILRRFPKLCLADENPDWGDNFAFRGLNTLRVTL